MEEHNIGAGPFCQHFIEVAIHGNIYIYIYSFSYTEEWQWVRQISKFANVRFKSISEIKIEIEIVKFSKTMKVICKINIDKKALKLNTLSFEVIILVFH